MNISVYLLDDEPHALDILSDHTTRTPGLELIGLSTNPLTALEALSRQPPDLLLADIDMPELSGLEVARLIVTPPKSRTV